jgi:protein TonB
MALRLLISAGLASAVTFGLFLLMHSLIAFGAHKALVEKSGPKLIDFVRLKRSVEPPPQQLELPTRQAPRAAPPPPEMAAPPAASGSSGPRAFAVAVPAVAPPTQKVKLVGGLGVSAAAGPSDADVIPLVRVQPMYPPSARQQKIEGWVKLRFNIGAAGAVESPVVVDALPAGVFEQAAVRAIKRWKYKPRVENGKPVVTRGVHVKLTFKLDDA